MGRQSTTRRRPSAASAPVDAPTRTDPTSAPTTSAGGTAPSGTPRAKSPAAKTPAAKKPTAKKPAAKKSAAKKPRAAMPWAKKSSAKKSSAKTTTGGQAHVTGAPVSGTASAAETTWRRGIPGKQLLRAVVAEYRTISANPLATYYLILISVVALTGLGLVMVLSASSITSYDGGEGSSFEYFNKQAGFAAVGFALLIAASFVPLSLWKKLAWPAIGLGVLMQAAVFIPGFGKETKGNANWIQIGSFQLQPSEFLKIALAVWLGCVLANKFGKMTTFTHAMIPVVPGIAVAIGLVVAGNDLGTALVLMAIALACLFIGGFPMKYFLLLIGGLGAVTAFYVLSSENRLNRLALAITGHADQAAIDTTGQAWQSNHGLFSLASGGWFGVGLGASREKWSWLPEAHNDFIFAIIGEELGLVGTILVLLVFTVLAFGLIRVMLRAESLFAKITTAGLFAWLIGQAAINVGVVAGLLPVIGLPLPFVSYGGSSIIASLLAVGVILSFARTEKGAAEAIRAHKDRVRSSFAVLARRAPGRKKKE
ncbi:MULTISPECIES: putative lipid II flippase FtsW [Brevibacterium]|uniref:Probable peptidoglycan glycosyltransferase FtsW n=1 Tax=Brevibacterium casei TaxID=33889 RepID=A0A7T3ZYB2_9MICO|nr:MULTISPECIES: putative lipid II flippase FtsW [Brevibacterium]QQB13848.1 putative lipid II flippase FtsW [Brevibacterium casei]